METIVEKLDRLFAIRTMTICHEQVRSSFIDSQLLSVAGILASFDAEIESSLSLSADLENEIKEAVLESGASVKSSTLQAVYGKPRETWEGAKLSAYAVACPAILAFRKVGTPSVYIREVK
jgi:hypothetical protein